MINMEPECTHDMKGVVGAGGYTFAIDRGGTFTDIYARCPDGGVKVMKLLSTDPDNYKDAPTEGIRRILQQETGRDLPKEEPLDTSPIDWIRMGTTVATNALLERKGARMALVITKGFRDLLYIGTQARPDLFDLAILTPDVLYDEIIEVDERVYLVQEDCQMSQSIKGPISQGTTQDKVHIGKCVDREQVYTALSDVYSKGLRSLAVVLIHSYLFPNHEREIGSIAKEIGFTQVSLSSDVMAMVRVVPRGLTACADAYLTPCIKQYLHSFSSGFQNNLRDVRVLFMQSDGGLTDMNRFFGSRAILSGPAGGVVGYAMTAYSQDTGKPVIGFDMGGTSTDVSRYDGQFEHVFETTTAGITIQAPQLDINTVAAGGGSRLFFRSGMFVVGPESAGAHPGPVCYRKGGPLCVTDANLVLGRLVPEYFPLIFGEKEDQCLDSEGSRSEFDLLTLQVNENQLPSQYKTVEETALGFVRVANEAMCRPIKSLTQAKGFDTAQHVLACFGGAGGQHACAIAKSLGMRSVFIHRYAGILSAYGLALADVVHESQEPCCTPYQPNTLNYINDRIDLLKINCQSHLINQAFSESQISLQVFLHMRYDRTDCAIMCSPVDGANNTPLERHGDFKSAFLLRYKREFGFTIPGRTIIIDDIRVRGVAKMLHLEHNIMSKSNNPTPTPKTVRDVYFEAGFMSTNIYMLNELTFGHVIPGPAIILDNTSSVLVEPGCVAEITDTGDIKIMIGVGDSGSITTELDTIHLSIFSHRFMSIAEQMGRVLQRTSISTNIKERLDFSCALFGPDGGLVANAPHIPVHLGAMQEAVRYQMRELGDGIYDGDIILSNHPVAGGSHLPDLTVITPVFYPGQPKPVFVVASRGHHADIGGATPGSMPAYSTRLEEEGATFKSFKLVQNGLFQEEELIEHLMAPGKIPGCSGSRTLHDNISDLKAQVAANQKGVKLVQELIDIYTLDVVQAYMDHIQSNAEISVREMLKQFGLNRNLSVVAEGSSGNNDVDSIFSVLHAIDYMDDGSPIELTININNKTGDSVFDFTGSGHEVFGNWNAPRVITVSAVIYCLRCMLGHDIPLNQGCLAPIEMIVPKGSLLNPSDTAAVIAGNVMTSQRLVDVILKAFQVCAASHGCMNNTTFGDVNSGYFETVAGGAGAGPGWDGRSGVHSHMTNTRITDPEILERRYPVILRKFCLRSGSGGKGAFVGGEGVIRELLFRRPQTLCIITSRRVLQPYGLHGGDNGGRGLNLITLNDGRTVNLGSRNSIDVKPGECFHMETPGGGGYGHPSERPLLNNGDLLKHPHNQRRFLKPRFL